ncbi:unnamed protein product, partial [Prorocentrum cordatum]
VLAGQPDPLVDFCEEQSPLEAANWFRHAAPPVARRAPAMPRVVPATSLESVLKLQVLMEGARVGRNGPAAASAGAEGRAAGAFAPPPYAAASGCEGSEGDCSSSEEVSLGAGLGAGEADVAAACSAIPAAFSGPSGDVLERLGRYSAAMQNGGGSDQSRDGRVAVAVRCDAVVGATWRLERAEAFESLQARFAQLAARASRARELADAREQQ